MRSGQPYIVPLACLPMSCDTPTTPSFTLHRIALKSGGNYPKIGWNIGMKISWIAMDHLHQGSIDYPSWLSIPVDGNQEIIHLPAPKRIRSSLGLRFPSSERKRSGLNSPGSVQYFLLLRTCHKFGITVVPLGMVYPWMVASAAAMWGTANVAIAALLWTYINGKHVCFFKKSRVQFQFKRECSQSLSFQNDTVVWIELSK